MILNSLLKRLEEEKALDKLEYFSSINGPKFYKLSVNNDHIELIKDKWKMPAFTIYRDVKIKNFMAGKEIIWKVKE